MRKKGFLENLLDTLALRASVEDSKDANGKPNPYRATGIAYALRGDLSTADIFNLGGELANQGAFQSSTPLPCTDADTHTHKHSHTQHHSLNWQTLSEEEKHLRILKAQHTKAQHRYWQATWEYQALTINLSSEKLAESVWQEISEHDRHNQLQDPQLQSKFSKWLQKNHDMRINTDGTAHHIHHKQNGTCE